MLLTAEFPRHATLGFDAARSHAGAGPAPRWAGSEQLPGPADIEHEPATDLRRLAVGTGPSSLRTARELSDARLDLLHAERQTNDG